MQTKTQLIYKVVEPDPNAKRFYIQVTSMMYHTDKKRTTNSVGNVISGSISSQKEGRVYKSDVQINIVTENPKITEESRSRTGDFLIKFLNNDPDFITFVKEKEKLGFKVVFVVPKDNLSFVPGKDTIEFMNSIKGKRILRKLAKKSDRDTI